MRWVDCGRVSYTYSDGEYRIPVAETERLRAWYIAELGRASAPDAMADLFSDDLA